MAVISELFLALAGFASGISQNPQVHPAVAQTFAAALQFGSSVRELRQKTTEIPHPVCRVLKRMIVVEYLKELALLEARIVSLLKKEPIPLPNDTLKYSAIIMGETADLWQSRFAFGLETLAQSNGDFEDLYRWLQNFARINIGSSEMRELGTECLRELDRQWLSDLKRCVLGEIKQLNNHPIIENQLERIEDTRLVISQLQHAAFRDIRVLDLLVGVTEEISRTLVPRDANDSFHQEQTLSSEGLTLPLLAEELDSALQTIQCAISKELSTKLISRDEVAVLVVVLREVVLFGSSLFEQCFVDSGGDVDLALDGYLQHADPRSMVGLHPEIVRAILTVVENKLCIRFISTDKKHTTSESVHFLKLVLTKKQCASFEMIFAQLAAIVRAKSRISVRCGPVAYRYSRFYISLWEYYQNCIDDSLAKIQQVLLSDKEINIRRENDKILGGLVYALFLDSEEFISALHHLTASNYDDLGALAGIIRLLATAPDCGIDIGIFQDLL